MHFPIESGRNEPITTEGQEDKQLDDGIGNTLVSIDQMMRLGSRQHRDSGKSPTFAMQQLPSISIRQLLSMKAPRLCHPE
jgi:hypothetical protein